MYLSPGDLTCCPSPLVMLMALLLNDSSSILTTMKMTRSVLSFGFGTHLGCCSTAICLSWFCQDHFCRLFVDRSRPPVVYSTGAFVFSNVGFYVFGFICLETPKDISHTSNVFFQYCDNRQNRLQTQTKAILVLHLLMENCDSALFPLLSSVLLL